MDSTSYLKHIEDSIEDVKSINLNNSWAYEQIIHSFLKIKHFPVILYPYKKGNLIFRSRINDKELFENISEISFPKEEYVKNYARANKPRQSLFYGSENRPTSYSELIENLAETTDFGEKKSVTIGGWRVKQDITLALIYNPLDKKDTPYNKLYGYGFEEFVEKNAKEHRDGTIKLFSFVGEEYSKPVKDNNETYLITCAYSNILFSHDICEGIIYPSVPSAGNGFNIVLKNNVVSEGKVELEFVGKDTFLAVRQENGKHEFVNIESDNAIEVKNLDNLIKWK